MAVNTQYDIVKIETDLFNELDKISTITNLFVGSRPESSDGMDDFIVVKVNTQMTDKLAYGQCVTSIQLFVRNYTGGIRNSARISTLFQAIIAVLPIELIKYRFHYSTNSNIVQDGLGFSTQIINLLTFIKR